MPAAATKPNPTVVYRTTLAGVLAEFTRGALSQYGHKIPITCTLQVSDELLDLTFSGAPYIVDPTLVCEINKKFPVALLMRAPESILTVGPQVAREMAEMIKEGPTETKKQIVQP